MCDTHVCVHVVWVDMCGMHVVCGYVEVMHTYMLVNVYMPGHLPLAAMCMHTCVV